MRELFNLFHGLACAVAIIYFTYKSLNDTDKQDKILHLLWCIWFLIVV